MKLYLMQHGLALAEEENPDRPLSGAGISGIETAARAMAGMGLSFDLVISSRKQRSRQTAEIVAAERKGHPLLEAIGVPPGSVLITPSALMVTDP